ncbi:hypothetical protein ABW20_dc0107828 [Dactylellina cionopaga]|nr:hypothetical protein ABW20_dc0107828 [Dactylellina cionopaga]
MPAQPGTLDGVVAIGLCSHTGDRFSNIELALRLLETPNEILKLSHDQLEQNYGVAKPISRVVNTSFLYETESRSTTNPNPDQLPLASCACIIETNIPPVSLLKFLRDLEATVSQQPPEENGASKVELSLLFYGDQSLDLAAPDFSSLGLIGQKMIPHPELGDSELTLRTLHDMIADYVHPTLKRSIHELLFSLSEEDPQMRKVIPFPSYPLPPAGKWAYPSVPIVPKTLTYWTYRITGKKQPTKFQRKTHVMATINATPDSYSRHKTTATAVEYARMSIEAGASLIDIGGYSAQPGSAFVTTEEETRRISPFVTAVSNARVKDTPISIDTFRAEVAEAGIKLGVNCINDIYAFTGRESWPCQDEETCLKIDAEMVKMKKVARDHATPVIMVHSRADAGEDEDYTMYLDGQPGSVIHGVRMELGAKIDRAVKGEGGIRRWMVIVDPGIGFSKDVAGNLEILKNAAKVVEDEVMETGSMTRNPLRGYPQLIATSRKAFLQEILRGGDRGRETSPKERVFATATTIACAVQQGALVVRVHDVQEMSDVCAIADALW